MKRDSINKRDTLFADLFGHYWTNKYLRTLRKDIGVDEFDAINWNKESAFRFVCENVSECERIFNHRHINSCK